MFDFEDKLPAEIPLVVLDTETTGLHPAFGDRVVEIGAIRFQNWRPTAEFSQLINPERSVSPEASAVNGITDEDLVDKPVFADVAGRLLELTEGALLVAHNASFDAKFLGMELSIRHYKNQRDLPRPSLPNPWLCTLQLARRHFYFSGNSLGQIARTFGVRRGVAHRALNDVRMTAEILKRMVRELRRQRLETVGDLLLAQGGPIYAPQPAAIMLPELIADALAKGQKLRILYVGGRGRSERIITPKYPTERQGVAYLVAHCHLRGEQRTFRLDRIFSAEVVVQT